MYFYGLIPGHGKTHNMKPLTVAVPKDENNDDDSDDDIDDGHDHDTIYSI
jgi:hypothetical protein